MYGLTSKELAFFQKLNTPSKIQEYLDSIPFNFEVRGETCMSPRRVVQAGKANCIEGGMLACTALLISGERPLLLNLKVDKRDDDHVVALFKKNGYWGAISKTNHTVLRFRDPIYRTIRELALSYFHEYFMVENGKKSMKGYSQPISMMRFGKDWITSGDDLWEIAEAIYDGKHADIVPSVNRKYIRDASKFEQVVASIPEWNKVGKRA